MQRRTRSSLPLLVALPVAVALAACGQQSLDAPPGDAATGTLPVSRADQAQVTLSDASAVPAVVAAADVIGLELIAAAPTQTTVTSPVSLQIALSMAAEGAEGQTLVELEALIGAEGKDRSEAINALTTTLEVFEGDPAIVQDDELPDTPLVHRADRLVLDDRLVVSQDFVDALTVHYGATAKVTDLAGPEGKAVLDEWVNTHTGGLIPKSAIETSPDLLLVLQDAIVLAARWETPFPATLTEPLVFTLPDSTDVMVDMMTTATERDTLYVEAQGWQAVRLPYTGGRLHADIVLPPVGTAPTELTNELLTELQNSLDTAQTTPVDLSMPVVDASSGLDLTSYLQRHAPAALAGGFGGMADGPMAIQQAVQQGVLEIDEEGTVAAAVTEISIGVSGRLEAPIEFTVDRPYLVRIADGDTGWPLFFAHIADPRSQE